MIDALVRSRVMLDSSIPRASSSSSRGVATAVTRPKLSVVWWLAERVKETVDYFTDSEVPSS